MTLAVDQARDNQEVLVAILNNLRDFTIAREQHWYRIPVSSADKWLRWRWPPQWLAFYHTKVFGPLAYGVHYYAKVINIRKAHRWQLFPDRPRDEKSDRLYYQLSFAPLQQLPEPILSRRWRRIVFIPTIWRKFRRAIEINDLYDESPLEDRLWVEFKRLEIQAERQEFVRVKDNDYALDFALYCRSGKIDVETDGDSWHANREGALKDNLRDNALETAGWSVLRFNTYHVQEAMSEYCVPTITKNIDRLGGLANGRLIPKRFADGKGQASLFDDLGCC